MKVLFTCVLALLNCFLSLAQIKGSVTAQESTPLAGVSNHYVYTPPKGLLIPQKIQALIAYESRKKFYKQIVAVGKEKGNYTFTFKAPDSTAVLIISLVDGKQEVLSTNSLMIAQKPLIDNNSETGFIIYLHDKQKQRFVYEKVRLAKLLNGYARYALQLKPLSNAEIIEMYDDAYNLHPALKEDDSYVDYLMMLYKEQPEEYKPGLLAYANDMLTHQTTEAKWTNAAKIFQLLNMPDELAKTKAKILSTFPNGMEAEQIFWNEFYEEKNKTEHSILISMRSYINRFGDSSNIQKDRFYNSIISHLMEKKDWASLHRYEAIINNKLLMPYNYNSAAWRLVDKKGDKPGVDLEYAKILSQQSLRIIKVLGADSVSRNMFEEDLNSVEDMFANTYALIQYKLGEYDSAFHIQHDIYTRGKDLLDANGMERYAVYAEKVMGAAYAKHILEDALLSGVSSDLLQSQLKTIYKKLNLPDATFDGVHSNAKLLAARQNQQAILNKFGTIKAKDFTLKNIEGQNVSLSSFINKVVVLDFWATWCGPCRASFPAMQAMLNKYKEDSSVVFLFIDVWENTTPLKMKAAASLLLKENKYSFTVLFDVNDKVVNDYKVDGIPAKFVIDKKGNIISMGDDVNDLSAIIEAARK